MHQDSLWKKGWGHSEKLLAAFLYQLVLKQEQMYILYYLVFSLSGFSQKSDQYI